MRDLVPRAVHPADAARPALRSRALILCACLAGCADARARQDPAAPWRLSPAEVTAVVLEQPHQRVTLQRGERGLICELRRDGMAPGRFPVDARGEEVLAALAAPAPLADLGPVDAADRRARGLEPGAGRLRLEHGGARRELIIGDRARPRSNDRWVLEPVSGRGFVLPGGLIDALEAPESIMVVAPVLPSMAAIDRIVVTTPQATVSAALTAGDDCARTAARLVAAMGELYVYEYPGEPGPLARDLGVELIGHAGERLWFAELSTAPDGSRLLSSDRIQPPARIDPTLLAALSAPLGAIGGGACTNDTGGEP